MKRICRSVLFLICTLSFAQIALAQQRDVLTAGELLARNAARVVNTVEHYEFAKNGRYLSLSDLSGSAMLVLLTRNSSANAEGLGRLTIDELSFTASELVPGYRATLDVSKSGTSYLLVLGTIAKSTWSFSSDETGILWQGTFQNRSQHGITHASALLGDARPITRQARQMRDDSKNVAGFAGHSAFLAPSDGPAICALEGGACKDTAQARNLVQSGRCCWNLGYADCAWCCAGTPCT